MDKKQDIKMNEISFSDWQKIDMRVAEILKIEDIEGADKLLKLTINVGELGERTICAGIKGHYDKNELVGKKIIILANLEPREIKSIKSEGMLLAAGSENKEKIALLTLDSNSDVKSGTKIS